MAVYDEHLFTFLSKAENFEPFYDLKAQYDNVMQRLINGFWSLVLEEAQKLHPADPAWVISLDEPNQANRKMRARHANISDSNFKGGIVFEGLTGHVTLGVWFNLKIVGENTMNTILVNARKFLETDLQNDSWQVGTTGTYFVIYQQPGLNLTQKASLLLILPEIRSSLVKSYAEQFIAAVDHFGSFCLEQAEII